MSEYTETTIDETGVEDSPLHEASRGIAIELSELDGVLRWLETRLKPLLQPEMDAVKANGSAALKAINSRSPHIAELRKHQDFAGILVDRVQSLLDRLEA